MPKIISTTALGPSYVACEIEAPAVAGNVRAGHLMMVRFDGEEVLVPAPITDTDATNGTVTFVARTTGGADTRTLAAAEGPVGVPADTNVANRTLLVGEGLGVAALIPRLRAHKDSGAYTITIAGYRSKEDVYWIDRLKQLADELYVTTADGSYSIKGPVKNVVKAIFENIADIEQALIIGPLHTLRTCSDVTRRYGIPTRISLIAATDDEGPAVADADFDWAGLADLDGHTADYGELADRFDIQTAR